MKAIARISQKRVFRKILSRNRDRLYRIAYSWTHDPALADDLVQQALYKALKSQKQLRDPAAVEVWLFRILSNCLKDHYRKRREILAEDKFIEIERWTPEHDAEEMQMVQKVRNAVRSLPLPQCQVVTLVDLEGFAYATVAQILDIPVGTVMSRLCRARRALRSRLLNVGARVEMEGKGAKPPQLLKRVK
jgi:RNA polymerase sigma-70 factor (ECF subfamily)